MHLMPITTIYFIPTAFPESHIGRPHVLFSVPSGRSAPFPFASFLACRGFPLSYVSIYCHLKSEVLCFVLIPGMGLFPWIRFILPTWIVYCPRLCFAAFSCLVFFRFSDFRVPCFRVQSSEFSRFFSKNYFPSGNHSDNAHDDTNIARLF